MNKAPADPNHSLQQNLLKRPYARVLIPEDDGTYSADMLEFPGCHAEGDTADEAISNLERAAASWIEAALEQGQTIPPPMVVHGYSGSINLRLPKSIHKQAARFSAMEKVSLNQFFASAIAARVGAEEFYEHLVQRLQSQSPFSGSIVNIACRSSTVMLAIGHGETPQYQCTESVLPEFPRSSVKITKVSTNG